MLLSIARLYTCSATRLIYPYTKHLLAKNTLISGGLRRETFKLCTTRNSFLKNFKISRMFSEVGTISIRLKSDVSKYKKAVGYWLLTSSGMVFVAVILGGVTRLTESGLSMVTWKLLGEKMPSSEEEWEWEFKKYQEYPEFQIQRRDMTLREFKFIWSMEYMHRMWGRAIGAAFLLPATFFWMQGAFTNQMKIRVVLYGGLILAQGLIGWYMVKSGLDNKYQDETSVVRVSHYRLATHLSLALVLYSLFLWSSLDHLLPAETVSNLSQKAIKSARKFRVFSHGCKGMVFLTAISGAFLAGLDGGLVYNSFPKMADKWIPDDILAYKPTLTNFTENPTTVQFDHRVLGVTTLTLISTLWVLSTRRILPRRAYLATNAFAAMAWIQVALGITTLLMYVPVPVAASHQSGSLVLLSMAIWLTHELKRLPKI